MLWAQYLWPCICNRITSGVCAVALTKKASKPFIVSNANRVHQDGFIQARTKVVIKDSYLPLGAKQVKKQLAKLK